ncbi:MAG: YraN family protein [Spirochaetales bacterium]|nr:MAG: YraN family protein [Spirochaetales bacterium]
MTGNPENTREKGNRGEREAALYLAEMGYTIIKRNFKKSYGEVDIISSMGDTLIFSEVKTWTHLDKTAMEHAINRKKIRKIVKTSKAFLMENPAFYGFHIRYDILFNRGESGILHIPGAFTENETG